MDDDAADVARTRRPRRAIVLAFAIAGMAALIVPAAGFSEAASEADVSSDLTPELLRELMSRAPIPDSVGDQSTVADETGAVVPDGAPDAGDFADILADTPPSAFEPAEEATPTEREDSADAHTGLSDSQALDLAQQEFGDTLAADDFAALELNDGEAVGDYLGPYGARIEHPGDGPWAIAESGTPLTTAGDDTGEPLDPTLVQTADGYEAETAAVEAQLPAELTGGIAIPDAGVELTPAGVAPAQAKEVDDKLFYANATTDTDYVAAPTPTGASLSLQLRSAQSPERHPLDLELPPAAQLGLSASGGAEVTRGDETLATVSAPVAWDAAGSSVPVRYELAGQTLTIVVSHADRDPLYPIYVDPVIDAWDWGVESSSDPWVVYSNREQLMSSPFVLGQGLKNRAAPGGYVEGDVTEWLVWPWGHSYVERVDFQDFDHRPNTTPGGPGSCAVMGIWDTVLDQTVSPEFIYDPATGTATSGPYANLCSAQSHATRQIGIGLSSTPDGPGGDPEAPDDSLPYFALISKAGQRLVAAENLLRSATVYRYDRNAAQITSTLPSQWVDTPVVSVHDDGLGAYSVGVFQGINGQIELIGGGFAGCDGTWRSRCAPDAQIPVDMAEGTRDVSVAAYDPILNPSAVRNWTARIDQSAPVVDPPTGSLFANRGSIRGENSYQLNISAHDDASAPTGSGVKRLEVWVDDDNDEPIFSSERPASECNLAGGGCPMTMQRTWQVDPYTLGDGRHKISVVAIDKLGHASPEIAQQFMVQVKTDVSLGPLTLSATQPAPDGSYELTARALEAHDTGDRPVSGVSYMELIVDGQSVQTFEPGCPAGNCDLTRTYQMSGSQSLAEHHISVIVYDRAGNGTTEHLGKTRNYYERFGYTGASFPRDMRAAGRGGANIIRVIVDWCDIAENRDPPPPQGGPKPLLARDRWRWGGVEQLFTDIRTHNQDNQEKLRVIAVLYNSPPEARLNPNTPCSVVAPPADGFIRGTDSEWRYFVTEFTRRFGPASGFTGARLEAIELWNEPNLPKFWGADSVEFRTDATQTYADLVNVGSSAVDSVAGSLVVLPGAMSPLKVATNQTYMNQQEFIRQATQEVARPIAPSRINGISIHLYADGAMSDPQAIANINDRYERLLDGLGTTPLASRPRWITEVGFPAAVVQGQRETTQRHRLHQTYIRFASKPNLRALIIHTLVDREGQVGERREYGVLREIPDPEDPDDPQKADLNCKLIYEVLAELRESESVRCPPE